MLRQAQRTRVLGTILALLTTSPAAAQPAPSAAPYDRAIAAGYKALTLCSAIFVAGRTQAQAEALELTGIYPQYDALIPTLHVAVIPGHKRVEVPFDATLPPRTAQWTPWAGCVIQPIGWPLGYREIPVPAAVVRRAADDRPAWPLGEAGIAPAPRPALVAALARGFDGGWGQRARTTGTLVVKDGRIVAERYADGFGPHIAQRTWSVAKSLTGTLIGVAVAHGALKTGDPARIPEWSFNGDPRSVITFDNLLRMASGLHSATAGNRTDAIYFGGTTVTQEATAWPLEALPGTRFRYANDDILLAAYAAQQAAGRASFSLSPSDLFDRLGMGRTVAEQDWRGNYILSSQVWTTPRDLARFGLLYLQDGVWNGERILPSGWAKYVTTPSGPQPAGPFGYGATFWLLNKSPGVPADTYAAIGNRGQYVVIVPSRKVVIVRRGEDPTGASFDIAGFTAEILAALP